MEQTMMMINENNDEIMPVAISGNGTAIRVMDDVTWTVKPYGKEPFEARGVVEKIYSTVMGGSKAKVAARVRVTDPVQRYKQFAKRTVTTVSVDQLQLARKGMSS